MIETKVLLIIELQKKEYAEFHTMLFISSDCDTSEVEWI